MLIRLHLITLVAISLLGLAGCDPDFVGGVSTAEVAGQVMMDGQPVEGARVVFIPYQLNSRSGKKQQIAYGLTDAEGNFELMRANGAKGACRGLHRVVISKSKPANTETDIALQIDSSFLNEEAIGISQPDNELIPVIYNRESNLEFDVDTTLGVVRPKFELSSVDPLLSTPN